MASSDSSSSNDSESTVESGDDGEFKTGEKNFAVFGSANIKNVLQKATTTKNTVSKAVTIHDTFKSDLKGMSYALVVFGDPGNTYYLQSEHVQASAITYWEANFPKKKVPDWIKSITSYTQRATPHGENKYWRSPVRNTTKSRLAYVFSYKSKDKDKINVRQQVTNQVDLIYSLFRKREPNNAGTLALDYLDRIHTVKNDGTIGGLYGYIVGNSKDTTAIEMQMTSQLNLYYQNPPIIEEGGALDKYLCDFDIKALMETYLGANDWGMVPKKVRKVCYRDYGTSSFSLPVWNQIVEEKYRGGV